jgi:hypothetical protein
MLEGSSNVTLMGVPLGGIRRLKGSVRSRPDNDPATAISTVTPQAMWGAPGLTSVGRAARRGLRGAGKPI